MKVIVDAGMRGVSLIVPSCRLHHGDRRRKKWARSCWTCLCETIRGSGRALLTTGTVAEGASRPTSKGCLRKRGFSYVYQMYVCRCTGYNM